LMYRSAEKPFEGICRVLFEGVQPMVHIQLMVRFLGCTHWTCDKIRLVADLSPSTRSTPLLALPFVDQLSADAEMACS